MPLAELGLAPGATYVVEDLLDGARYTWRGARNYVQTRSGGARRAHLRRAPARSDESDRSRMDPLWYKDALIYEVHVRAFADSNGDGIGDFAGLTQKLPYLQDLGVTCLWLLPFYPSPLRDDGYDIADYTSINPIYGTLDDFKRFLDEAHARNIRVLTELVINHTSDQHPWFQRARRAPKGSPERDFYVWSDTDTEVRRHAHHLHRHREVELDVRSGRRPGTTGTASSRTSRTSTSTTPRCWRPCSTSCASGSTWASMRCGSTPSRT